MSDAAVRRSSSEDDARDGYLCVRRTGTSTSDERRDGGGRWQRAGGNGGMTRRGGRADRVVDIPARATADAVSCNEGRSARRKAEAGGQAGWTTSRPGRQRNEGRRSARRKLTQRGPPDDRRATGGGMVSYGMVGAKAIALVMYL
jgi:hypothetical protein